MHTPQCHLCWSAHLSCNRYEHPRCLHSIQLPSLFWAALLPFIFCIRPPVSRTSLSPHARPPRLSQKSTQPARCFSHRLEVEWTYQLISRCFRTLIVVDPVLYSLFHHPFLQYGYHSSFGIISHIICFHYILIAMHYPLLFYKHFTPCICAHIYIRTYIANYLFIYSLN